MTTRPFTPEQIERLREIAEARDDERQRVSRFSIGEQQELDDTAKELGFNEKQSRELSYRFRRRWLPVVGYLILAIGSGYAVGVSHQNEVNQTKALRQSTYNVLQDGCRSGNELRTTLQGIIVSSTGIKNGKKLVREGRISQADLDRALKLARQEAASVAPRNCSKAYAPLKPKP